MPDSTRKQDNEDIAYRDLMQNQNERSKRDRSRRSTYQTSMSLLRDCQKHFVMTTERCRDASCGSRKCWFVLIAFTAALIFAFGLLVGYFSKSQVCSKNARDTELQHLPDHLEALIHTIKQEKLDQAVRYFSREPHVAGSQRQTELANEIKKRWEAYEFEVDMPEYDVFFSTPNETNPDNIQLLDDKGNQLWNHTFVTQVKADPRDNKTWNVFQYMHYSPRGSVQGGLLYANQGRKQDFEYLKRMNISSCNGSIVIVKRILNSFDALPQQLENAYNCNALGLILFQDQKEVSLNKSEVYPATNRLPKRSPVSPSLRESIGDPLTPGLPAIEGVYRLIKNEANLWAKIPVQLVEYRVAKYLLSRLKGSEMPEEWKPKAENNSRYRVGPFLKQNSSIRFTINTITKRQKVYNVIGTVYGKEEPDYWVLIGNHRDAVSFGGGDAVSGTAAMMEISRGIGELIKKGWRPRRTIKLCSWAAEETGLIGSNEWVEENIKLLQERAVVYINMDVLVAGNYSFRGKGNPMLTDLIFSETQLVKAPYIANETVYSQWRQRRPANGSGLPQFPTSSASSDFEPFYEQAAVPCLDLQYFPKQGLHKSYHTPYDTYHWMKFIDPQFRIHLAQTKVAARLLFRLSNSTLLPFNLTYLTASLQEIFNRTDSYYGQKLRDHNITLDYIKKEIKKIRVTIQDFENIKNRLDGEEYNDSEKNRIVQMLNRRMALVNKMFISPEGVPNRPTLKNIIHGISQNRFWPNITFVAISDAIIDAEKSKKWEGVKRQVSVTLHCISQARQALEMRGLDKPK